MKALAWHGKGDIRCDNVPDKGEIDPSFVITHRASLDQGPELYKTFRDKKDGCIKVVLKL